MTDQIINDALTQKRRWAGRGFWLCLVLGKITLLCGVIAHSAECILLGSGLLSIACFALGQYEATTSIQEMHNAK